MKKLFAVLILVVFILIPVFADDPETVEPETPVVSEETSEVESSEPEVPETASRPTVALVLSGGGAKGIAHIPIIEALERYGIPIDKVYGTSMGALIGGLYAAGLSPGEMRQIVTSNDLTQLFTAFDSTGYTEVLDAFEYNSNNVLSLSLGQGIGGVNGFIDDYLVLNFFNKYIGNVPEDLNFDTDLVVPFECNAADMLTGDEVIFNEGNLITAMRASMSLPLIFEPVILDDGTVLMDGGIVSNYIVHRAVEEGYDIIIVVTLNAYGKEKYTAENYSSLSGAAGSTLQTVLNNVSKGEVEMADFWFSPDLSGYNTLSFGEAEGILARGDREAEEQQAKLEDIAALFTEEQKVYKDPNRVGEYATAFPERQITDHKASREKRHEDLMGRTRVSIGLYGSGGYGFFFDQPEYEDPIEPTRALYPTLSLRAFIKDLNGSRFSFDIRLKLSMNKTTDLHILNLVRLTPDEGERIYALGRLKGEIGSRSFVTDKSATNRLNKIEGLAGLDLGVMVTNEKNHSMQFYFSLDNTWDEGTRWEYDINTRDSYAFVPSATLTAVYYPNYTNGFFSTTGARVDFLAKVGYNTKIGTWLYNLGLAAEYNLELGEKVSVWADAMGYTGRGSQLLRSTFEEYGGWDGVPGYAIGSRYSEFIMGGVGLQVNLKPGFISNFLALVVRAGIRSDIKYGWSGLLENPDFDSMVPFSSLNLKRWDLGVSVGYGVSTPIGDLIFGAGYNLSKQLALYVEMT